MSSQIPGGTYLKIGIAVDVSPPIEGPEASRLYFLAVRLGARFASLDASSAAAWLRASAPVQFETMLDTGASPADVDSLITTGLVSRVPGEDDETAEDQDFLSLLVIPQSMIVSADFAESPRWTIGDMSGRPLARLRRIDQLLWSAWNGRTSIADSIETTAKALGVEPHALVPPAITLVTALAPAGAIVLDRAA